MNQPRRQRLSHPEEGETCCSKLLFCWLFRFVRWWSKNYKSVEYMLFDPAPGDQSEKLGRKLKNLWQKECLNEHPSFTKVIIKLYLRKTIGSFLLLTLQVLILQILIPLAAYQVILEFRNGEILNHTNSYLISALVCVTCLHIFLLHHIQMRVRRVGIRIKVACQNLIIRKMLKVYSSQMKSQKFEEHLIDLLTNRMDQIVLSVYIINFVVLSPLLLPIILYCVYLIGGFIPLMAFTIVYFPLLSVRAFCIAAHIKVRKQRIVLTNHRIRFLADFIENATTIKMYCCQEIYQNFVDNLRRKELTLLKRTHNVIFMKEMSTWILVPLATLITVSLYHHVEISYSGAQIFVLCHFYFILAVYIGIYFPASLISCIFLPKILKQVTEFLELPMAHKSSSVNVVVGEKHKNGFVSLENVIALYTQYGRTIDMSFEVLPGQLCVIAGPADQIDKTAILKAIIGEIEVDGRLMVVGSVSYCSNLNWIFSSSVRQNILFGSPFDRKRYTTVVNICLLHNFFLTLNLRDKTIVRENELMNDVKTKINLARCLYKSADIYLFDQAFLSLDHVTASNILPRAIFDFLGDKTRIIITGEETFINKADLILEVSDGTVKVATEISNTDFENLSQESQNELRDHNYSQFALFHDENEDIEHTFFKVDKKKFQSPTKLYSTYLHGNTLYLKITGMLLVLVQVLISISDYYLIKWTFDQEICIKESRREFLGITLTHLALGKCTDGRKVNEKSFFYYVTLSLSSIIMGLIRWLLFARVRLHYAKSVSRKAFKQILYASAAKLSSKKDIEVNFREAVHILDESLPVNTLLVIPPLLNILGGLTLIFILCPLLILPGLIILPLVLILRHYFCKIITHLSYIEASSTNAVNEYIKAVIKGIELIRSYNCDWLILNEYAELQNNQSTTQVFKIILSSFTDFYVDLLCLILLICFIVMYSYFFPSVSMPLPFSHLAFTILQLILTIRSFQFALRYSSELIFQMICVQNLIDYSEMEIEGPLYSNPVDVPDDSWPDSGAIVFRKVFMLHAHANSAVGKLANVNLTIQPSTKIGFLGKSDSGNVAIMYALFKILPFTGTIYVDGVHLDDVGLNELRGRLAVIPAKPFIIPYTSVRRNVDLGQKVIADFEIRRLLEIVGLNGRFASLDAKICDHDLTYEEKQLISLARVLVRPYKIILLHETEVNARTKADETIHRILREKFAHSTVIIISNKLGHLLDMDQLVVMDDGLIVAEGTPTELVNSSNIHILPFLKAYTAEEQEAIKRRSLELQVEP